MNIEEQSSQNIVIINRSFWPTYPILGEGLLQISESLAGDGHVIHVVTQNQENIANSLKIEGRGEKVKFHLYKSFTNSASNLHLRAIEVIFFSFGVILSLIKIRPDIIYVSTDPPIFVPFTVGLYSKVFDCKLIYHVQDIHPEAISIIKPMNKLFYLFMQKIDSWTMRNASKCITLTEKMESVIISRSGLLTKVKLIDNPAVNLAKEQSLSDVLHAFCFCGNLGRFQRIPLLVSAVDKYLAEGGGMKFIFAGGGKYAPIVRRLASQHLNVHYEGKVDNKRAEEICSQCTWAILPIVDEVLQYAFPSKFSTYVSSGASILSVCGSKSLIANTVTQYGLGTNVEPDIEKMVLEFKKIEALGRRFEDAEPRALLKKKFSMEVFVNALKQEILER